MENSIYKRFIASALMLLTLGIYTQFLRAQEKIGDAPEAAPFNDAFSNAISVFNNSSVSGTNVDATRESGEPFHAGFAGERSVWYRHTATGTFLQRTVVKFMMINLPPVRVKNYPTSPEIDQEIGGSEKFPVFDWLKNSNFTGREWRMRSDAFHAKSKTYNY